MHETLMSVRKLGVWMTSVALASLGGCASGGGTAGTSAAPVRTVQPTTTSPAASSTTQGNAAPAARIARLKRSFDCTTVGDAGMFVCSMKDGVVGSLVRKRIEPVITSSGTIFLRSVYRDRDWIYHDHVVVRVGETELRTTPLPATSPNVSRREVRRTSSLGSRDRRRERDDYVDESVSYRGADGTAVINAIALAGPTVVTMQLAGGPRTFEKALSDDEKRLFAEARELAALLRGAR